MGRTDLTPWSVWREGRRKKGDRKSQERYLPHLSFSLSFSLLSLSLHLTPPSVITSLPQSLPSPPLFCMYFIVFYAPTTISKTFKWLFVSHPFRFITPITCKLLQAYIQKFTMTLFCYGYQGNFIGNLEMGRYIHAKIDYADNWAICE